ncbi:MAG: hypothetical protein ACPG4S_02035 [Schleiferiaceae bacterium]
MLLRNFRKIDAYSSVRLAVLAAASAVGVYFTASESLEFFLLFVAGYFAFGSLCWLLYTERWAFKGTLFRFLAVLPLLFPYVSEFTAYSLVFGGMILETNWQFAEYFRRRRNPIWVLHIGTLSALGWFLFPEGGFYIAAGSLVSLLLLGGLNVRTLLQVLVAFFVPISLPLFFSSASSSLYFTLPELRTVPPEWWLLPGLVFVLTIHQFTISYRKANNLNKLRSLIALTWIILGSLIAQFIGGEGGFVLLVLGLSYQGANALYYFRRRTLAEIIFALMLLYSIVYALGFIEI